jgi:diacylglycerol kinase
MKNKNIFESFKNAFEGLRYAFLKHRNFRILFFIGLIVLIFAFCLFLGLNFTVEKLLVLILLIGTILSLELLNTSIELLGDHIAEDRYDPHIKIIKDVSAGAVFLLSLISIIIGFFLFLR